MDDREARPWLDILRREHDCGPSLAPYRTIDPTHRGSPIRVAIPDNLAEPERPEIRAVLGDEHRLPHFGRALEHLGLGTLPEGVKS